jgi:hypothetical protein
MVGALITGGGAVMIGAGAETTGVARGVPMARGAPSTAGAIAVPHGEPLWNQLRHRPRQQQFEQPLLAVKAASANRIVNFLMFSFSAASARRAPLRTKGGRWVLLQEGRTVGRANVHHGE